MNRPLPLGLSQDDQRRLGEVEALAGRGAVPELVQRLSDPSWAVRRGVVDALARLGDPAVEPLCAALAGDRGDEALLAAAVDALAASRGEVDGPVGRLAEHADPHVVADAAQILGRRRSGKAVPILTRLAAHADDNVAVAALEALGRIGGTAAVDALLSTVAGGNFFRTFPALEVLGRSGDPRAIAPLARLLDSTFYAPEAARALGHTGLAAAVPPLAAQLHRGPEALVRAAAVALADLHDAQRRQYGSGQGAEKALRSAALPQLAASRLAQSVPGATPDEQRALARVLGWLGSPEASATLLGLLEVAPEPAAEGLRSVGHDADRQLGEAVRLGDSARRKLLLPLLVGRAHALEHALLCLDDPAPEVRAAAAEVLSSLREPAAVPVLFAHLGDPDLGAARAVVGAVESIASAETEQLALAAARSPDPRVRHAALGVVAYFGFSGGLQVMEEALAAGDERLRDAALAGLPYLDEPRAQELLLAAAEHPSPRTRASAMRALGQTAGAPAALAALRRGVGDPDPWVAYYACQALGKQRDEAAAGQLVAAARHPSGQVRVAAVEALAHLASEAAGAALRAAASSSDQDIRRAALQGLGASRAPGALPTLLAAAGAGDRATRVVALTALADRDEPEVLPVLAQAAADRDEEVRAAAVARLAEWRNAGGTHVLIGLLGNPAARERALEALSLPTPGRIAGLLSALEVADGELPPLLVSALARMDRPDARAAIVSAVELGGPATRAAAVEAVGALDLADGREALARAAERDPDPGVRRLAAAALAR
ncbi:HEAT repeat domain-containing protein [Anaeromyxobacter diazotrophicus]|uniref:PBS lyase HEAT domain protein repeat-containing protein n=1 Tax=Anaeromyxobacter diazotrophicus TaxID=2590199 RepID=A0A7I9VL13_9BACT|nr:HEAT repeat domain-containing protein [Anaeromyxobacter diazotrophicus]GEJ57103.1 hypothetical protein AMYX_18440 [Anaeromyxobacter diazotrophicus]